MQFRHQPAGIAKFATVSVQAILQMRMVRNSGTSGIRRRECRARQGDFF
jgi:hypothetical protein